jgi:transcriptional regulator of NAD metabolism
LNQQILIAMPKESVANMVKQINKSAINPLIQNHYGVIKELEKHTNVNIITCATNKLAEVFDGHYSVSGIQK